MAKKPSKKSKSRGRKPKGTVSTKTRKTPYDIARNAIYLKMEEDSYQQVLGNVSKSCNI